MLSAPAYCLSGAGAGNYDCSKFRLCFNFMEQETIRLNPSSPTYHRLNGHLLNESNKKRLYPLKRRSTQLIDLLHLT